MTLERRQKENGTWVSVLTECPACGYEFKQKGCTRRWHLLHHDPEDFGL